MNSSYTSRFSGADAQGPQFVVGVVMDCNPSGYTVDVKLPGAGYLTGIPVMNICGPGYGQDLVWLQNLRGAQVLLVQVFANYVVLGTLPEQSVGANHPAVPPASVDGHGGSNPRTYGATAYKTYSYNRPTDFFPGDKIIRADGGAQLGLFREGVAWLKASPLAQFILGGLKDFCRLIARTIQIFSDFGEVSFTHNSDGRVGVHLKGGADFANETHPAVGAWTVQVWAGDHPDNPDSRLHIKVNDVSGAQSVTMTLDTNGDYTLETTRDRIARHGGKEDIGIQGDRLCTIGGNEEKATLGDATESVAGEKSTSAGGVLNIVSAEAVNIEAPEVNFAGVARVTRGEAGSGDATQLDVYADLTVFEHDANFLGDVTVDGTLTVGGYATFNGGTNIP